MSVAKLRDIGVVATEPDPADRRRTVVRPTARMLQLAREAGGESLHSVLAEHLTEADRADVDDAVNALELLARLFAPEVVSGEAGA